MTSTGRAGEGSVAWAATSYTRVSNTVSNSIEQFLSNCNSEKMKKKQEEAGTGPP